jgi:hypothetical protein
MTKYYEVVTYVDGKAIVLDDTPERPYAEFLIEDLEDEMPDRAFSIREVTYG